MSIPKINVDVIECGDESRWLAERRKRVQASEASQILGQSNWGSALSVYADKTSPALITDTRERFTIGHELESPICSMYGRKFGGKVHRWPLYTIAASREHAFLGATPDALVESPDRPGIGLLEIKTASEYSKREWMESAPLVYQIQVQAALAATGLQWGVLAVLIGVQSVERIFVDRNQNFIDAMLPLLADFWSCVELRVAPPVDGSPATAQALARLHPADNGLATRLSAEFDSRLSRLRRLKSLGKRVEKTVSGIENEIKSAVGDHTFGVTPDGQWVSWKSQTRKATMVSESTFRVLRECKEPHLIEYADGNGTTGIDYKAADRTKIPEWIKTKMLNDDPHCKWCGCTVTRATMTVEHVVPLEVGGTNDQHNLALACAKCNHERGSDATLPTTVLAKA